MASRRTTKVRRQPSTIEEFYAARGKEPNKFTINKNGDLVAPPVKDGDNEKIFTLPTYRALIVDEKRELDAKRRILIGEAEQVVQDAQHVLHDTLAAFRNNEAYASDVVVANLEVGKAEKALQKKAWPLRNISLLDAVKTNVLLKDQPYETRTIAHSVYKFSHGPYTLQDIYVTDKTTPESNSNTNSTNSNTNSTNSNTNSTNSEQSGGEIKILSAPMTAADRGRLGGILKRRHG